MSQEDDPGVGAPDALDRPRRAWLYLVVVAAAIVVPVAVVIWMSMPRPPSVEYRPSAVDVVVSFEQAGAAWNVGLESGTRFLLTDSVRDLLRPVSGAPLSPRVGDLVMTDSLSSPTWVAFSEGGSGVPGEPCFAIHEEAFVAGDRIVFRSGLSVPIGSWRRDPPPSPNETITAGACLDRQGDAVERLLGLGARHGPIRSVDEGSGADTRI